MCSSCVRIPLHAASSRSVQSDWHSTGPETSIPFSSVLVKFLSQILRVSGILESEKWRFTVIEYLKSVKFSTFPFYASFVGRVFLFALKLLNFFTTFYYNPVFSFNILTVSAFVTYLGACLLRIWNQNVTKLLLHLFLMWSGCGNEFCCPECSWKFQWRIISIYTFIVIRSINK